MKLFPFNIVVLLLLLINTNSLYFHLFRNEKRCFYDEFYSELVVMVRYNILDKNISFTSNKTKRLEVYLYSTEDKKIVYKHETAKLNGKFSYTIEKSK
jgi:hypothetical protein